MTADGLVVPVVPLENTAHHAGTHNPYSVGIEFTQTHISKPFTEGHYAGLGLAVRTVNEWLKSRHLAVVPIKWTDTAYGRGLIGHAESEQGRAVGKTDPGPAWSWPAALAAAQAWA